VVCWSDWSKMTKFVGCARSSSKMSGRSSSGMSAMIRIMDFDSELVCNGECERVCKGKCVRECV